MPALSLGIVSSALLLRIMRTAMIEVLSSDYVRTARAKGAAEGPSSAATPCAMRSSPI